MVWFATRTNTREEKKTVMYRSIEIVVVPLNTQSLMGLHYRPEVKNRGKKSLNRKVIVVKGIEGGHETFAYDAMENEEIIKTFK